MNWKAACLPRVVLVFICGAANLPNLSGQELPSTSSRKRWSGKDIRAQLDVEPSLNQLPYSPADGSTVALNPPPFVWVPIEPIEGDFIYQLQVSRDKEFKTGVIARRGIDINTYALEEVLAPGQWYWRYGVEGGEDEWNL